MAKFKYILDFEEINCLVGETMVFGSNNEIKDLRIGDKIIGIDGEEQYVLKTFKRKYKGPMVIIKALGCPPVTMTPEHLVLTVPFELKYPSKSWLRIFKTPIWKFAKDIKVGDWLIIPRRREEKELYIKFRTKKKPLICYEHLRDKAISMLLNGYSLEKTAKHLKIPTISPIRRWIKEEGLVFENGKWRKKKKSNRKTYEKIIKVDEDISWIFGLYIAEGYVKIYPSHIYEVCFSFGIHEKKLARKLKKKLKEKLNINSSIYERKERSELVVRAYSKDLAYFLKENFGVGAKNKHIPEFIKKAKNNVIRGLIKGIFDGDGSRSGNDMHIATASKKLALDIMELCLKIGIFAPIYYQKPNIFKIRGKTYKNSGCYLVPISKRTWNNKKDKQGRKPYTYAYFTPNFVYVPVKKVDVVEKNTFVYNLQTSQHVYCVPFIVHNCPFCHFHMLSRWICNSQLRIGEKVIPVDIHSGGVLPSTPTKYFGEYIVPCSVVIERKVFMNRVVWNAKMLTIGTYDDVGTHYFKKTILDIEEV